MPDVFGLNFTIIASEIYSDLIDVVCICLEGINFTEPARLVSRVKLERIKKSNNVTVFFMINAPFEL